MSTPIEHIAKEYLFRWLYNEEIPLTYIRQGEEYHFTIQKQTKDTLSIKPDRPIPDLKFGEEIDLLFDLKGIQVSCHFRINTKDSKKNSFTVNIPETLYKDLERSFFRVPFPDNLCIEFSFDDRYQLPYPKFTEFPLPKAEDPWSKKDIHPLLDIITQLHHVAKEYDAGIKVVLFKDIKQKTIEEQVIVKTGKVLYLPCTKSQFIEEDPFPEKRLITKAMFKAYLKSIGENPILLDIVTDRFLQSLYSVGIFSAIWAPIFFHEYIIGYVHLWHGTNTRNTLDHTIIVKIDSLMKDMVASMRINGYFEANRVEQPFMPAQGINISPSGIYFTFILPIQIPVLRFRGKMVIKLTFPNYVIQVSAEIVRWKEERLSITMVCHFLDMKENDMDYLFEFLYGRRLTDPTASLVVGTV